MFYINNNLHGMTNTNKALKLLTIHHSEFIKIAKVLGGNHFSCKNYAEDYVQEAYLRLSRYDDLYDKIITKGKASKGYVFFTLRSIIINAIKKKSNLNYSHLGGQFDFEETFNHIDEGISEEDNAKNYLDNKIYTVLKEKASAFDYELFRKYTKTRKSFRTIAKESGLGVRTIYLSIKRSKEIIAENLYEDYLDFINGDYDKLN